MQSILTLIGREDVLFPDDLAEHGEHIADTIKNSSFLVIGGGGAIGRQVVKELFVRNPRILHAVDISENNLVELVRDIRSSFGYIRGDFKTYALDCGSREFEAFFEDHAPYDFILNLSALKHVRSERDPYSLMRMVDVNILNTENTLQMAIQKKCGKYFCVSTDKATSPVNMMGASKRIMEMFLFHKSLDMPVSTSRFANVAFSDGSLLHGFRERIRKRQPISAPLDVKRYFITPQESGELCVMSCVLGENRDIFFPKLDPSQHLVSFADIARRFLRSAGFEPLECESEEEARKRASDFSKPDLWPCYFDVSDTTGEKEAEEFYTQEQYLDMTSYFNIGVIKGEPYPDGKKLAAFKKNIRALKDAGRWCKKDILGAFEDVLPDFRHIERYKYLDDKM